jgi:molecular chaperone DnaK
MAFPLHLVACHKLKFDIDQNGILKVSAKDKATGRQQNITITNASNLNEDEVKRMQADAERFATEDAQRKEQVELRNNADNLIYSVEKQLADLGDKVPAAEKTQLTDKVAALRSALTGTNTDQIQTAFNTLQEAAYALSTQAYQQSGDAASPTANNGDDVMDAEFKASDEVGAGK